MATVHRTFVNRGKHEITELKPNYVYAVEYTLDSDAARTLGIRTEQVGLIVVNHYGKITYNYNMAELGEWSQGEVVLDGKHVWYACDMEIQFAINYVGYMELCHRFKNMRQVLAAKSKQVTYYQEQALHRFVEGVIECWNGIKNRIKGDGEQ